MDASISTIFFFFNPIRALGDVTENTGCNFNWRCGPASRLRALLVHHTTRRAIGLPSSSYFTATFHCGWSVDGLSVIVDFFS